jgi:hypothetical protein
LNDSLSNLTTVNLDDLVASFGWSGHRHLAAAVRAVFRGAADKFARQMLEFDRGVGEHGLPEGSRRTQRRYVRDVRVFGFENLPASGPLLVLSNHPGMTDTLSLFAAIGRADLRVIALDRPFLKSLPWVTRHLFYVSDDSAERIRAVKKATMHLRGDGAVLTFPAGHIEPDPDVYPGALESLKNWTSSAGVFMRFAPGTRIVPALVRSVLWDQAVRHPLTRIRPPGDAREQLGAALQLLMQILFELKPVTARVQFAKPISAGEVSPADMSAIHTAVLERMRGLIANPPRGEGVSVL